MEIVGIADLRLNHTESPKQAVVPVIHHLTRAGNLLPHPCGIKRSQLYPIPLPKTSRDFEN